MQGIREKFVFCSREVGGVMKFSVITISFFLLVLLLAHSLLVVTQCPSPVPDAFAQVRPGNVVAAYFGGWDAYTNYQVNNVQDVASDLTHLLYAFVVPSLETGRCELMDPKVDVGLNLEQKNKLGGNFAQLRMLKNKNPHLKLLLSFGGGTHSKIFFEIARQGKLKECVTSLVDMLDYCQSVYLNPETNLFEEQTFRYAGLFDGLDIDIEWSSSTIDQKDVDVYHLFIKMLSRQLRKKEQVQKQAQKKTKKYLLTSAVQVHPKIIAAMQLPKIAPLVNWFHVMTYDYGGPKGPSVSMNAPICNAHSSLSIDGSLNTFMNEGISPTKLVLGIPLYGQVYDKTKPKIGASFSKTEKTRPLLYKHIKKQYLDNDQCHTKWHEVSKAPYAYCPDDGVFVSYDNHESIKYKVDYAKFKKLKGIFFWRLSGDDQDHSLIKSLRKSNHP